MSIFGGSYPLSKATRLSSRFGDFTLFGEFTFTASKTPGAVFVTNPLRVCFFELELFFAGCF